MATAALLIGCTRYPFVLDAAPPSGHIAVRLGRPGVVVAAPHGSSDVGTGEIADEISRRTGFGLVVATGFDVRTEPRERPARRYQVNRPFEGVPGRPPGEEIETAAARSVYASYERRVRDVSQGPLHFYVEIHGNSRREAAERVEVATVGVDRDQAIKLRTLLELVRDAHLRARPPAAPLAVRVEPADPILFAASGAKRAGILRLARWALHVELPRVARGEQRELYTLVLADFLRQAIALPPPAGR